MDVNNKYYFKIPVGTKSVELPFEMKWDFIGQDDSIDIWEKDAIKEAIGVAKDFDILRFSHKPYGNDEQTRINYKFYFYNSSSTLWENNYEAAGFTIEENYYISNSFEKSFFKLDFYDTNDTTTQSIQFTVILPIQTGEEDPVQISPYLPDVLIERPEFILDYVKNREGFFWYWMRDKKFLNLDTFYMSAKFFDAKEGVFVRLMNTVQSALPNPTLFDASKYFYYRVFLDYTDYTYQIFDINDNRIGTGSEINWYEYIDPS
jgi:hypothetical protein